MEKTVTRFLRLLKIPISGAYVERLIQMHPDFPSLLSISDVLKRLGIQHVVRRIKNEDLIDINFPVLLPIDQGKGELLLIEKKEQISKYKDSLALWSGVVLEAESKNSTDDTINNQLVSKYLKRTNYVIGLSVIIMFSSIVFLVYSFSLIKIVLLLSAVAGTVIGYFLEAKEMGVTYKAIDDFCNAGKNTNCDKVVKSDFSIYGVGFTDVAFTYFLFQVLTIMLSNMDMLSGFMPTLAWISLLTLPVIMFSLYYQKFVVETWCRLCLLIVSVLIVQLPFFIAGYWSQLQRIPAVSVLIPLLVLFVTIGALVMIIKFSVQVSNQLAAIGVEGNRVKHNPSIFYLLLHQQKKIGTALFEKELRIGRLDAPIKITMASNLYCKPCKEKHAIVNQLVNTYPDEVVVFFRYVKNSRHSLNNISAFGHIIGYWLEFIQGKENETDNTVTLLHDWYEIWDLEKFSSKYLFDKTLDNEIKEIEEKHYYWCDQQEDFYQTPTFFVNGHSLPKEYAIDDLLALTPLISQLLEKRGTVAT